jgi:tetratricopeptide (TPR) repeat protein
MSVEERRTMRRALVIATVLGLAVPGRTWGGIYNFAEAPEKYGTYEELKNSLAFLRQINNPELPTPHRLRYLLMADLAEKGAARLDDLDRINLSGYLLRLRDPKSPRRNEQYYLLATELLQPLVRRDPKNFLAQANLATAWLKLGQLQRAQTTQSVALEQWPRRWKDLPKERRELLEKLRWNEAKFQLYREAEKYQLKLLLLRLRESQRKQPPDQLDPLFDTGGEKVQFVGPGGKYEPGKLAAAERQKLPANALAIVEQLVLWDPDDLRLRWLAAELFNAEGEMGAARDLLVYLSWNEGFNPPELKEHRDILVRQAPAPQTAVETPAPTPDKVEPTSPWPTNPWQLLGVGFGAGAVVALLGVWQVREIRRRAAARP